MITSTHPGQQLSLRQRSRRSSQATTLCDQEISSDRPPRPDIFQLPDSTTKQLTQLQASDHSINAAAALRPRNQRSFRNSSTRVVGSCSYRRKQHYITGQPSQTDQPEGRKLCLLQRSWFSQRTRRGTTVLFRTIKLLNIAIPHSFTAILYISYIQFNRYNCYSSTWLSFRTTAIPHTEEEQELERFNSSNPRQQQNTDVQCNVNVLWGLCSWMAHFLHKYSVLIITIIHNTVLWFMCNNIISYILKTIQKVSRLLFCHIFNIHIIHYTVSWFMSNNIISYILKTIQKVSRLLFCQIFIYRIKRMMIQKLLQYRLETFLIISQIFYWLWKMNENFHSW